MPAHFTPEAFKFLRGLKRNNDRTWFNDRKHIYETQLKAPMLALITEINEHLLDFAPHHIRPAQKIMMRIYRDIRFSTDKRPYKLNVAAWWAREGLEKTSGGGYYLDLNNETITIAAGVYMPERDQLLAIRRHLLDHHEDFRRIVSNKKFKAAFNEFDGRKLTRAPKGFPTEHPALDLILHRQWGVSTHLPTGRALLPTLAKDIATHFRLAAPLVDLLNTPLTPKPRKPLF
ncbi:DUF2461 domain-containing protein [Granulicella arctica]|uniref:Uncharacterized protein (TIGR02453 family) n=1 Tax=Granulicella arctica TaxID=940613 RepID=A0A7Y9TGB7_9BACT|nr:DUF2461 domain-containing protein [Granulicella arctica]NYF78580.1 uncharacterized protein (TIGR02453 family) [Granulicella arctica]